MKGFLNAVWIKTKWFYKSRYRILSCVFIIILILPTVAYPLFKNILSAERDGLNENRNLNKFEFSFQNFGANFEIFYQDNFPFRNSLIPLYNKYYNKIYSKYFTEKTENINEWDIIDEPVINELYIIEESIKNELEIINESAINEWNIVEEPVNNELNIFKGPERNDLKEEENNEFKRFMNVLIDADNYFKPLNKKIIFQVCPRKYYITSRMTSKTQTDLLSSYIDLHSNVSFSYPKNKYLAIAPEYMTYDEYNGHHNFLGAYVSWQEIQKKAGIATTDINSIDISKYEIDVRKIIAMPYNMNCCYPYNQDLPAVQKTEYITSINYNVAYKPDIKIETLHNSGCNRIEIKSNNTNGQTLFITGDSFLETQLQYAIKDFEFSNISHLYNFNTGSKNQTYRDRIKKYIESSDVIVIVIGENNLWSTNIEENPGLEYRIALILELAKEIYR